MALYLSENETIDLDKFDRPDWFETGIRYNYEKESSREILFNYTNANVIIIISLTPFKLSQLSKPITNDTEYYAHILIRKIPFELFPVDHFSTLT